MAVIYSTAAARADDTRPTKAIKIATPPSPFMNVVHVGKTEMQLVGDNELQRELLVFLLKSKLILPMGPSTLLMWIPKAVLDLHY